jgi:CheY-like chemotaxis protein
MRVLYVDDDRVNTILFEETCRVHGQIEVACAGSCAEAVAIGRDFAADALVLDLHLPDGDGFGLLAQLKSLRALAAAPAFLCTADDPRDIERRAVHAGFAGCWGKPIEIVQVLEALSRSRRGAGGR